MIAQESILSGPAVLGTEPEAVEPFINSFIAGVVTVPDGTIYLVAINITR